MNKRKSSKALPAFLYILSISMLTFEMSATIKLNNDIITLICFLAVICIALYLESYLKIAPKVFVSSIYQIIYFLSLIMGSYLVSIQTYMFEIQQFGTANGTFWIVIFFFVTSCEATRFGYSYFERNKKSKVTIGSKSLNELTSNIIIVSVIALSSFILLRYGGALAFEGSRINYWGDIAPKSLSFVRVLLILTFFILSIWIVNGKPATLSKYAYYSFLALYIFFAIVLLGEKFSIFVIYLSFILFASATYKKEINYRPYLLWALVIIAALMITTALIYQSRGLGFVFIFARFALQAQILWITLNEDLSTIFSGLLISADPSLNFSTLRADISERYLPWAVQIAHAKSGTTLSGYSPAWQILMFGLPMASVVNFGYSFAMGALQNLVIENAKNGRILYSFLIFTSHFFLLSAWYVGNFNVLPVVIFLWIGFFFLSLIPRKKIRKLRDHVH